MLSRRFRRTREGNYKNVWQLPDLIVIDGGKGQLSTALKVLGEYKIDIPCIGLAKRFEEIVYADNDKFNILQLEQNDSGLNILKKGRDEAHRFGITYYKKLHQKDLFKKT
jgi:excinuclease ABC subunit C